MDIPRPPNRREAKSASCSRISSPRYVIFAEEARRLRATVLRLWDPISSASLVPYVTRKAIRSRNQVIQGLGSTESMIHEINFLAHANVEACSSDIFGSQPEQLVIPGNGESKCIALRNPVYKTTSFCPDSEFRRVRWSASPFTRPGAITFLRTHKSWL